MGSVKDTRLYDLLGVEPGASAQEIKRAYRSAALKHHPDKNGHSEESKLRFQQVCEAYEVLGDDNKRELYNRYGSVDASQSLQETAAGPSFGPHFGAPFGSSFGLSGMSAGDMFAQFFGGGSTTGGVFDDDFGFFSKASSSARKRDFGTRRNRGPTSHGPDIKHKLKCSLDELYKGKHAKLALNRTRLCATCKGSGGKRSAACETCSGTGVCTQSKRHGPMVQTWSSSCPTCSGSGVYMRQKDICADCEGQGCTQERKIFDVEVQAGMVHGQEIVLPGEADEVVKTAYGQEQVIPGDVIIKIQQSSDEVFKRFRESELVIENFKVDLKTSLCGGTVWIDGHPKGSVISIEILPGEIIKPGSVKCVETMGMPKIGGGFGNLYIEFEVVYPDNLQKTTIDGLADLLDKEPSIKPMSSKKAFVGETVEGKVIEEHVLSNLVPDFENDARGSSKTSSRANHKRRKFPADEESDSSSCTVH
ncbi:LAMI_0C10308g1_1 [Lachancea mirantina]|uniref:LAMI_0C10308g1_1 n=1 Tax=Lachancea mirantina TaxID=1230905 RepID=A0A1G4J5Q2_9SACH|nr:LAMI_0C10308g1_1 [Lachancea mirantina]